MSLCALLPLVTTFPQHAAPPATPGKMQDQESSFNTHYVLGKLNHTLVEIKLKEEIAFEDQNYDVAHARCTNTH